ncbi:beta-N-acetylhexosaminidase [Rhizocola hellebori]|uniref:beta-N-acetylhexosaminidase n=1 Tax=Rhizocola hellebori TaxID=1392758 RepID=A0A8J3Q9V9_9ACTN|nr:beta-N-acetylhexosaminidase [Rhizocola hellebori]GIH06828.1 beta-N-acetylhexosaminidase [Rhizocola hellebori]
MFLRASLALLLSLTGLGVPTHTRLQAPVSLGSVVPVPVSTTPTPGVTFEITANTAIFVEPGSAQIGCYLAGILRPSTGFPAVVYLATGVGISLLLSGAPASAGAEGYQLDITATSITIRANQAAGLFHGVQTLRQLLPVTAESTTVQPGPWLVPGGQIVDYPRFSYRGAMLDVARHFFPVPAIKRYVDQIVLYKVNHLHLHLSDDQGWRIAIDSWPRLASYGGATAVGGDPGGYYTKADYTEIVNYAVIRHLTIVPEIDMPGHTNAALASYAKLNCNGVAPARYTGMKVGFSSLCVGLELTYTFIDNVIGELAALTRGPYLHIGGDEASSTSAADYATFVNRVQGIVAAHGKTVIGFHDVLNATELPSTVAQFWWTTTANATVAQAAGRGTKIIMSPANKTYLDMKYRNSTRLGLKWAGLIEVQTAYEWNPGAHVAGVGESSVLGVEAPLWSETIRTSNDIEYLAFPRLPALMELAWSPASSHNWEAFRQRLAAQGPRWQVMGVDFYPSPQIGWPTP